LAVAFIGAFLYLGSRYTRPADDPLVGTWYDSSNRKDRLRVEPGGAVHRFDSTGKIRTAGTWKPVKAWSYFPNTFNPGEAFITEEELSNPVLLADFHEGGDALEIPESYVLSFPDGNLTVAMDNSGQGLWVLGESRGWLRARPWAEWAVDVVRAKWEGKPVPKRLPHSFRPRPHRLISF